MMPERADSTGYGTRIRSGSVWPIGGAALRFTLPAPSVAGLRNSHSPLRFCQSGRVSCGRGYSGSGLVVETWLVQGVVRGGALGATAAETCWATAMPAASSTATAAEATRVRRMGLL